MAKAAKTTTKKAAAEQTAEQAHAESVIPEAGATPQISGTAEFEKEPEKETPVMTPIGGLGLGRTVHYVPQASDPLSHSGPEPRPAVIVRIWDAYSGAVNLQVFTDGRNDRVGNVEWRTSATYDPTGEKPHSWHFPPVK